MFKYLAGFRKFIMAVIFLLVAVILLITNQIPSDDWMKHLSTVMVAFMATNVGEHIINIAKTWVKGKKNEVSSDVK